MWHDDFNGLPDEKFLAKLDPVLSGLRERLFSKTYTCDTEVGNLSENGQKDLVSQLMLKLVLVLLMLIRELLVVK